MAPDFFDVNTVLLKYVKGFDGVLNAEGAQILRTPFRVPNANAFAERFVRTVRSECLDCLLIVNDVHLEGILRTYARHYNRHRPRQGISWRIPARERAVPLWVVPTSVNRHSHHCRHPGRIRRYDRLGGLIHECERAARGAFEFLDTTGCLVGYRHNPR